MTMKDIIKKQILDNFDQVFQDCFTHVIRTNVKDFLAIQIDKAYSAGWRDGQITNAITPLHNEKS